MAHKVQPSELLMLLPHFLYRPAALKNQSVLYDKKKINVANNDVIYVSVVQ